MYKQYHIIKVSGQTVTMWEKKVKKTPFIARGASAN